jgi:MioC protein
MTFWRPSRLSHEEDLVALNLTILVGTMTGTAELVAEEVRDVLREAGAEIEILPMDALNASVFERGGVFLVCTSTYGQGDIPDNGQALFGDLEAGRPDLSRVEYGVIALGDRTYAATFCFGGKRFDALLASLGARRVGDIMLHDASAGTMPEEVAVDWARDWIDQVRPERDAAA